MIPLDFSPASHTRTHSLCTLFSSLRRLCLYTDKPDYSYLRRLFKDLALRNEIDYDGNFDWRILPDSSASAGPGSGESAPNICLYFRLLK